jgi:hypothetical protein
LICEVTDYPWLLYHYHHVGMWERSFTFCQIWGFIDWGLYITQTVIFAWATTERHILIFHDKTRKKFKDSLFLFAFAIFISFIFSQEKDVRQEPTGSGAFPMHSTGTHRKHTGRWKQYSSRIFHGFFPMISDRFPPESTGNSQESIGKKFPPEYCFHFRCFPAGYGDFSAPFLQDPAGYGGRNLRPGLSIIPGFTSILWPTIEFNHCLQRNSKRLNFIACRDTLQINHFSSRYS